MSERNVDKGKRIIIGVSTLFLVAVVGAIVFGFNLIESSSNGNGDKENVNNKNQHVAASVKAVQTLCLPTNYKEECEKNLMTGVGDSTTTDPYELIKLAFNITIEKITDKFEEMNILHDIEKEPRAKMALETCKQLMDLSVSELERSFIGMSEFNLMSVDKILMNLKVWLSGALTYQDTCLDEFENTTSDAGKKMQDLLTTGMHMTSNGLSIITALSDTFTDFNATKLLGRHKSKRVNWNGILNLNSKAARLFSPSKFFHGLDWVRATGVPCFPSVPPHYRHKQTILPW
ncbi:Pectinesterase inhibitor 28 Pectin methylesterase [Vigna angularis]|uniref:Pectinesterase inhibitor 28 Pectin methylesterase n=1 Tax=Phaseolus angularis TaxID=3914 RepID=A0A8T0JHR7_PHAAN|nr:Pectinesterase inhibitor 28 Pectin methylesterase [Vigna angularis]